MPWSLGSLSRAPRNATILLELLSSTEDFGTFAAYMAGEAKAQRGGYGATPGLRNMLSTSRSLTMEVNI